MGGFLAISNFVFSSSISNLVLSIYFFIFYYYNFFIYRHQEGHKYA